MANPADARSIQEAEVGCAEFNASSVVPDTAVVT